MIWKIFIGNLTEIGTEENCNNYRKKQLRIRQPNLNIINFKNRETRKLSNIQRKIVQILLQPLLLSPC